MVYFGGEMLSSRKGTGFGMCSRRAMLSDINWKLHFVGTQNQHESFSDIFVFTPVPASLILIRLNLFCMSIVKNNPFGPFIYTAFRISVC
jgi:hypothetical protein